MAMNYVGRKAMQVATKKFLNQEMQKHANKDPGGQWVSKGQSQASVSAALCSLFADEKQDPYFEYRPNKRGKLKKVKKQIPAYVPEHDAAILAKVRKWAYRLDVQHSFLGMRFGWSAVIGAIPEIGDAVDFLLAVYVYSLCRKIDGGLDDKTKLKMKAWIATGALIGLVPFIGDVVDASIKCNARNCRLLEEFLDAKHKPRDLAEEEERVTRERRHRDPSYRPPAPATVYDGMSDDEHDHRGHGEEPPTYRTRDHTPEGHRDRINTANTSGRAENDVNEKSTPKPRRKWSSRK
jgi:hypothetical protein